MANLLDPTAAAELLSVSPKQLEKWRLEGGGPVYVKLGYRTVRYRDTDLEDFITANTISGAREPEGPDPQSTSAPDPNQGAT